MTLTGHWNRAWERPFHFEKRDELVGELRKWEGALDLYHQKIEAYIQSGGRISRTHELVFECVVRLNLKELGTMIEMRDILAGTIPEYMDSQGQPDEMEK